MDVFHALFIMFIWGIVLLFSFFPGLILGSMFEVFFDSKIFFYIGFIIGAFAFVCFVGPYLPRINEPPSDIDLNEEGDSIEKSVPRTKSKL